MELVFTQIQPDIRGAVWPSKYWMAPLQMMKLQLWSMMGLDLNPDVSDSYTVSHSLLSQASLYQDDVQHG